MSLYVQWKNYADQQRTQEAYNAFWEAYFAKETENYKTILQSGNAVVAGKISELAEKFDMDAPTFAGFIDGINTSLVTAVDLDALTEDSEVALEIDFEKLYFNMHEAKADWLYNLPEWEDVLPTEKRAEIAKEYRKSKIAVSSKVGRNDPCPCGSGKKYKACCATQG